jgi:transcriptional regulator with XRE-family HTH domain
MPAPTNLPLLKAFAAEIKSRRVDQGLSQEELAFKAGLSRTFLGKIEVAQNQPTLSVIYRISEGLGIAPEVVMAATSNRYKKELRAQRRLSLLKPIR